MAESGCNRYRAIAHAIPHKSMLNVQKRGLSGTSVKADRRVRRTRDRLGQALRKLMEERPLEKISVRDVIARAGVVLVGDAFASTCPVAGTGTDKVFTDVTQLCNVHIPAWLASEGMGEDKIAAFYDDPIKKACDEWAIE